MIFSKAEKGDHACPNQTRCFVFGSTLRQGRRKEGMEKVEVKDVNCFASVLLAHAALDSDARL